jgi:hypothetical protein
MSVSPRTGRTGLPGPTDDAPKARPGNGRPIAISPHSPHFGARCGDYMSNNDANSPERAAEVEVGGVSGGETGA